MAVDTKFLIAYRENLGAHPELKNAYDALEKIETRELDFPFPHIDIYPWFVRIDSGVGLAEIDGDLVEIRPGTVIKIEPRTPHRIYPTGDGRIEGKRATAKELSLV